METVYRTEGDKHISLLENGFIPVEEKQINIKGVISQLEGLKDHCKDFVCEEPWDSDVKALDYAIQELERTVQEVPVQEQLTKKDVYCIAKHLQVFVKKYYHEQDISDSAICENCDHVKECTQNYVIYIFHL